MSCAVIVVQSYSQWWVVLWELLKQMHQRVDYDSFVLQSPSCVLVLCSDRCVVIDKLCDVLYVSSRQ